MESDLIDDLQEVNYENHVCKARKEWEVVTSSGCSCYLAISGAIPAKDWYFQLFESPETRSDAGLMQTGCCPKRSPRAHHRLSHPPQYSIEERKSQGQRENCP